MKVIIFGGTGFIGKRLQEILKQKNHELVVCDIRRDRDWEKTLGSCDAVINLAGTSLFAKRWNDKVKSEIHSSRVEGTKKIVAAMGSSLEKNGRPKILINGSAIGYYGATFNENLNESSPAGTDFLAFVCREWEEAALRAQNKFGIRTVLLRTGVVLGKDGGALQKLLVPFRLGLGGPVGCGKQWFSWIHIDDECGLILHALENSELRGALNATAPEPLTNKDFSIALGKALHRPAFIPLPGLALWTVVGEAAEILVNGQKVLPYVAEKNHYRFKYPQVEAALNNILS